MCHPEDKHKRRSPHESGTFHRVDAPRFRPSGKVSRFAVLPLPTRDPEPAQDPA